MSQPITVHIRNNDFPNVNGKFEQTGDLTEVKNSNLPNENSGFGQTTKNDLPNQSFDFGQTANSEEDNLVSSLSTLSTENHPFRAATLVFFDIETTGLAHQVGKKNVQITEISMIAVDRNDFCKSAYPDLRDTRILHKLSLCIRPSCPVSAVASKLTGLSDDNLQSQEPFDENTATAVTAFLSHLRKPVALLAHNGNVFDFPLLKAEFQKLKTTLTSDYYAVDTLVGFRHIGVPDPPKPLHKDVKFQKNGKVSLSLSNLHLYFFGKMPLACHSSEGDCIALAKVCHMIREKLLPWIDEHCTSFSAIQPTW